MNKKLMGAVGAFLVAGATVSFNANAVVRTFTPVDAKGNPIGPSNTLDMPDVPDAHITVQGVDRNADPVGDPVDIPDGIAHEVEGKADDGMVEVGSDFDGRDESSGNDGDRGGDGGGNDVDHGGDHDHSERDFHDFRGPD